jgi:hypothetical protein
MSTTPKLQGNDRLYSFDQKATDSIRDAKAWLKDPMYFKRVKISPSASIKMMSHCQSGVEKGIKNNGNPIEVMGFLLGHPDAEDPHAFIISDAQVGGGGDDGENDDGYCGDDVHDAGDDVHDAGDDVHDDDDDDDDDVHDDDDDDDGDGDDGDGD